MTPSHAAVKRGGALCTVHRGSQPLGGRGASRKQSGGLEVGRDSPVFHCMHMGLFNRAEELPIVPRASQPLGLSHHVTTHHAAVATTRASLKLENTGTLKQNPSRPSHKRGEGQLLL